MDFNHLREFDLASLRSAALERRSSQSLLDRQSGAHHMSIKIIRTPPDLGSLAGTHTHDFEQVFYVLAGVMSVEVNGRVFELGPESVFVLPPGTPHRTWNATTSEVLHLSINSPLPAHSSARAGAKL